MLESAALSPLQIPFLSKVITLRASLLISLSGAQTDELRVCIDVALCPALPLSWQQRVFFFSFFFFLCFQPLFLMQWAASYERVGGEDPDTKALTTSVWQQWWSPEHFGGRGLDPRATPFITTCHHCPGAAQSPGTARGAHAVVGILFKLSLQQSRLRSEWEPKRSHPSYLFNDVQSKASIHYRSLIIHVDTITNISSAFYLLLMKRSGWTCRSVKSNN